MKSIHRRIAAGVAVAAAVLGTAGTALAATQPTNPGADKWHQVQQKVSEALHARQKTLAELTSSVQNNKYLTSDHRQALQALLGPETDGINSLTTTVDNATPDNTTIAQLRQDAQTMVHQYRVYLVMAPQVHLTETADAQTDAELRISGLEPKIQARIAKAGNPPDAVQAYNDLLTQVANASKATGQADIPDVLKVTPPGFPGDGAPLTNARTDLRSAQQDLKAARTDLQIIRNAIQQGDAKTAPSTTTPSTSSTSGG
jgi:hypothetical protein